MSPGCGLFLSYARADEPVAARLYDALTGAGQEVWFDMVRLRPGTDWWQGVRCAIDQCSGLVLLASDESSRSTSCARELAFAVARGKQITRVDITTASAVEGLVAADLAQPDDRRRGRPCRRLQRDPLRSGRVRADPTRPR